MKYFGVISDKNKYLLGKYWNTERFKILETIKFKIRLGNGSHRKMGLK